MAFLAVAPFLDEHVTRLFLARAALLLEIVGWEAGRWRS